MVGNIAKSNGNMIIIRHPMTGFSSMKNVEDVEKSIENSLLLRNTIFYFITSITKKKHMTIFNKF